MIKYFCDRCGEEMRNARKVNENVLVQFDGSGCRTVSDGTFVAKLYCDKCKTELAMWLKGDQNDGNDGNDGKQTQEA